MMPSLAIIIAIDTLFTFASSPVGLCADGFGGVYSADRNRIYHFCADYICAEKVKYDSESFVSLSGIFFSGQWLFASSKADGKIYRFDRKLSESGKMQAELFSPEQISVSSAGELYVFDTGAGKLRVYHSFGEKYEEILFDIRGVRFLGTATSDAIEKFVPTFSKASADNLEPIVLASNGFTKLYIGAYFPKSFSVPKSIERIYLSQNVFVSVQGSPDGTKRLLHIDDTCELEWNLVAPSFVAIEGFGKSRTLWAIVDKQLLRYRLTCE